MTQYLHSSVSTPMRDGLKRMLRQFDCQRHITFAFHELITMERATAKVSKWYLQMLRRIFGRTYKNPPPDLRFEFILLPETAHGYLHFHGVIQVPESHVDRFNQLAEARWKKIARKGELLCEPIGPTTEDSERWFGYITKGALAAEVLHSSMLVTFPSDRPSGSTATLTR